MDPRALSRPNRRAGRLAAAVLWGAAFLAGCTAHPPQIQRVSWQQNLVHEPERSLTYPALSLFVQVDDADGLEDLHELHLIHDGLELYWSLGPTTWTRAQQDGGTWIGTTTLALPDGRPLPSGEYRLVLMDLAGETGETRVWIQSSAEPPAGLRPPRAVQAGGTIRLEDPRTGAPAAGSWTLWVYGTDTRYRGALEYRPGGLPVAAVLAAWPDLSAGFSYRLYRAPEADGWGLIAGPWSHTP